MKKLDKNGYLHDIAALATKIGREQPNVENHKKDWKGHLSNNSWPKAEEEDALEFV